MNPQAQTEPLLMSLGLLEAVSRILAVTVLCIKGVDRSPKWSVRDYTLSHCKVDKALDD